MTITRSAALRGAVHLFVRTGVSWSPQALLEASNADPDDQFGFYLGLAGDDNSAPTAGAIYLFE